MTVPDSGDRSFRVDAEPLAKRRMEELRRLATSPEQIAEYVEALTVIVGLLKPFPTSWGDPLYATKAFNGVVYRGHYFPLIVHYVAYAKQRIVMILRVDPDPRSFLDPTG